MSNTGSSPDAAGAAKSSNWINFRRLLNLMLPYWPSLTLVFLLSAGGTALEMMPAMIVRQIVDRALPARSLRLVLALGLLIVAVNVVRATFNFAQWVTSERTGQKIIWSLRKRLHDHIQELSPRFFARMQTGQVMSRLTGDVDSIQNFVGFGLAMMLQVVLVFIAVLVVLVSMDWRLTLVSCIPLPFLFISVYRFDRRIHPAWEKVREQMGKLTTVLQESITGVRVVKAFAREPYEMGKFADRNRGHLRQNLERAAIEARSQPLMDFLSGLTSVILIGFGGYEVIAGRLSVGSLIAFQQLLWALIWPVRMLGWLVNDMEKALAAVPRLHEILDAAPEIADGPEAIELPPLKGEIRFENVSFSFDGKDEVLHDISLTIAPGETVAIIGGTGSGKSTFINLIPRFHDPTAGRILVDGQDIRHVKLASLRRQIGIVLQETFLFSTSIRDNIAFGRPDASDDEIRAAAEIAQAAEFIDKLPQSYLTRVGERGVGLSGGQKQRVALARALLMDPRILILDEATASVDTETEYLIQEGLEEVMRGRTTLIIAKRLSTILSADKVVVLQGGEIAEYGTHAELLARGGLYKRIFDGQFARSADVAAPIGAASDAIAEAVIRAPGGSQSTGGDR